MVQSSEICRLRYPLLWIVDVSNPEQSTAVPNPECKKIPKFASFRDWLKSKYGTAYRCYLAEHLHEYGLGLHISNFLGLKVTNAYMLDTRFYRRAWNEVYVDVIMRVHLNVYTGSERCPELRKITSDYRVRGYYDLENSRCRLFECFMPYHPEDDLNLRELDDYLIPKLSYCELEDEAHRILKEYHCLALGGVDWVDPRVIADSMGLDVKVARIVPDTSIKAQLYIFDKETMLYRDNGSLINKRIEKFTILVNRYFYLKHRSQSCSSVIHECIHFEEHSLFMLFQDIYADEMRLFYHPINIEKMDMNPDDRAIYNKMEWQAKRLTPRVQMNDESVMGLLPKLFYKYRKLDKLAQFKCIIKDMAGIFRVSKDSAKYRLKELGLVQASGVLEYINGDYIPEYEVESTIAPYQTYSIEFDEFSILYANNADLRRLIKSGNFIYVEGHLCLNREKYIQIKNGHPTMTYAARHNMSSCCILFTRHYKDITYIYRHGVLQDSEAIKQIAAIGAKFSFIGNITDDFDRASEATAIKSKLPYDFSEQLVFHMARLRVHEEDLEELSGVSIASISRYRNDEEQNISEQRLLSITVGMSLEPEFNYGFLVKGGYNFGKNTVKNTLITAMLQTRYLEPVSSWREYLSKKGFSNVI